MREAIEVFSSFAVWVVSHLALRRASFFVSYKFIVVKLPSLSLPSLQIRPIHLYFLYLILVIGSVQTLSHVLQKSVLQSNRLPPPSLPQQQIVQRKSNPLQPVANKTSNNQQLVVGVKLEDDCWLRVVVDGKTEFEGVLPQGTHRTWQANRELTVRAGNAGGVYVAVNNANAKQLGQPGKVGEVTYRANWANLCKRSFHPSIAFREG